MVDLKVAPVGILFSFDFIGKSKNEKNRFYWKLYGTNRKSNYGKYTYREKGLLDEMKYIKPQASTIIVKREDSKKIRKFFKKRKVDFSEQLILLHPKQAKKLEIEFHRDWHDLIDEILGDSNKLITIDV